MKCFPAIGQRPIALVALLGVLLFGSCTKEELVSPCGQEEESVNTEKSMGQTSGDEVEGARNIEGTTLRSLDLDGDGLPDDDGISDDGDDEGDSERNRKVKN
jgi:hypothetical protein